jgi:hypothetical protein
MSCDNSAALTVRRTWRPRPDPINGLRPLVFHADADDMHVHTVHVFPTDDGRIGITFITHLGAINVAIPTSIVNEVANGMVRLAADIEPEKAPE